MVKVTDPYNTAIRQVRLNLTGHLVLSLIVLAGRTGGVEDNEEDGDVFSAVYCIHRLCGGS
jgi:hypothetical protein